MEDFQITSRAYHVPPPHSAVVSGQRLWLDGSWYDSYPRTASPRRPHASHSPCIALTCYRVAPSEADPAVPRHGPCLLPACRLKWAASKGGAEVTQLMLQGGAGGEP